MRARPWVLAAAVLLGAAAGLWRWSRDEARSPVAAAEVCAASADSARVCLAQRVAREVGSSPASTQRPAEAPGLGLSSARALAEAPEPVRAVVERFRLEGTAAEYEHLSSAELALRMEELRARRQSLESETERLHGEHFEALTVGNRARVTDLRMAIDRAVQERNRLAAALLVAGYVRGK
jgi:hypothetical protein